MSRENSLKETFKAINKRFGEGTLRMGKGVDARRMLSNIPAFDYVTDGGVLINRINEFYGPFSSLKSYFCYKYIGLFQHYDWGNNEPNAFTNLVHKKRKNPMDVPELEKYTLRRGYKPVNEPIVKYCLLVDIEGTYDAKWGEMLGIDNDCLIYYSPSSLEQTVDVMDAFMRNPDMCLIVLDSMHITGADSEVEESMEKQQMGLNARFWNKAVRKFTSCMNANKEKDITLMAINGAYEKVGITFGNPEVVKNGKQMQLAKSLSVKSEGFKEIKIEVNGVDVIAGRNIKLQNKKNKAGQPLREMSLYFSFIDDGVLKKGETDVVAQLIELGIRYNLIERVGNGYSYKGYKGRGMETFKKALFVDGGWKELKEDVYSLMVSK